ncbi:MAG: DNA/RNA non-specific endonuclease [Planctomycetota bacterium]
MSHASAVVTVSAGIVAACVSGCAAQPDSELLGSHLFGGEAGLPRFDCEVAGDCAFDVGDYPLLVKQGHVTRYDSVNRIPLWSAYRVEPSFREVPPRKDRFASFRSDRAVDRPVGTADYNGLHRTFDIARGHLAPFAVMGGDRDADGVRAELDRDESDPFDEQTVFDANLMSNIAPQYHSTFNGSPGLWFCLERWVQDCVVRESGLEVWVLAGSIVGPGQTWVVGRQDDISIPHMFYKIVVLERDDNEVPLVLAFLFPHQREAHGQIEDFLVPVDVIEGMTQLDIFAHLEDDMEEFLEDRDTYANWVELWGVLGRTGACDPNSGGWRPRRESVFDR